jgi:hypothetical protein
MKRVLILATLALFGISTLTTSCIVSKKKYNTAVANGRRSLDSLNRVFNKTVEGFNQATNSLKTNNSSKDITLDSLIRENQKLAGDKAVTVKAGIGVETGRVLDHGIAVIGRQVVEELITMQD